MVEKCLKALIETKQRVPIIAGISKGRIPTKRDVEKSIKMAKEIYKSCLKKIKLEERK